MTQILESTRNYLKTSTRLGRHMSSYKDESSGSDTSLHSSPSDSTPPSSQDGTMRRRSMPKKHLSGLFTLDSRRNSSSQEQLGSHSHSSRKIGPDSTNLLLDGHRRSSKSSDRTHRSHNSRQSQMPRQDISSAHMEEEVPRGQSPTMSMSNTVSTTTSTYDMRPSDYASMKQYQAHVWRRNLLEESIMHSLRLGYSERQQRSSLRYHQGRPSKKDTPRARRAREQAILAAATGKENSPFAPSASEIDKASQENIIDRSLKIISSNDRTLSLPRPSHELPSQQQFRYEKNSPYQLDYNASMTNIRHSFASFTLEVDDHHATHIMASSAVPELFRVKGASIKSIPFPRPQSRRNSRSSLASIAPSPRVLTGKKPALPSLHTVLPDMQDEDEEDAESPLTPTSAVWAESVFASLDVVAGKTSAGVSESEPKALGV